MNDWSVVKGNVFLTREEVSKINDILESKYGWVNTVDGECSAYCSKCNKYINDSKAIFCPYCGKKLTLEENSSSIDELMDAINTILLSK